MNTGLTVIKLLFVLYKLLDTQHNRSKN